MLLVVILFICLIAGVLMWFFHKPSQQVVYVHPVVRLSQAQKKVQQDPPEIKELRTHLQEFEADNGRWDILITVGDIYRKGAFPRFLPNEQLAMQIYKVAATSPDKQVSGLGQSKFMECWYDSIKAEDKAGVHLPTIYGETLCELAEVAILSTPWYLFEKPKTQPEEELEILIIDTPPVITYRSDAQNVHDHSVTHITKHNIDKIKVSSPMKDEASIRDAILNQDLPATVKEDALHVLDNLTDHTHSTFEISERDALSTVWDTISNTQDPQVQANLKETLTKQLACAVENGHIVCSSGKITRIMSTLEGTDTYEPVRPTWALREELGALAVKTRDENKDKQEFAKKAREEYIDKLGMSESIIGPLINEYEAGFD